MSKLKFPTAVVGRAAPRAPSPELEKGCRSFKSDARGAQSDAPYLSRECLASPKWKGSVLLMLAMLAEAHDAVVRYVPKETRDQYWKRPDVWIDIKGRVERYFSRPDADQSWRHNYVRYASLCGQWKVFHEQLPKMGWTNYNYFGGQEAFDQMVRTAQKNVTKTSE